MHAKDDYVLVYLEKGKALARVTSAKKNKVKVLIDGAHVEDKKNLSSYKFTFKPNEILCNFGSNPEYGKVYGIDIEPFQYSFFVKPFGKVYVFRKLTDSEQATVKTTLKSIGKQLIKMKMTSAMPIDIHIRPPKGKIGGSYKKAKNTEEHPDLLTISVKEISSKATLKHVIWHELGHHFIFRRFSPKDYSRWINTYTSATSITKFNSKELDKIRKELVQSESIKAYEKDNEDNKVILKIIFDHIKKIYKLDKRDLQSLIENQNDLSGYWPDIKLEKSELDLFVTEYSKKNYHELFCETLAYYMLEQELPITLKKLVKRTLKAI